MDKKEFEWCINEMPLSGEDRHYENDRIKQYNELHLLLENIKPGERGIIYISQIEKMIETEELLKLNEHKCISLWSKNNKTNPLNEEQIRVRDYIINHKELPDYVDILIINRACATSITIGQEEKTEKPLDFMIIHTTDENLQTQVRGRYRNDLKNLYTHSPEITDEIFLTREWLNRPLYKTDKDNLCRMLNIKNNKNGRVFGWTSIKRALKSSGYKVKDKQTNQIRFSIITE